MQPYVPGTTPPKPRGGGGVVVAVGLEAVRKAMEGPWRVVAVVKRGEGGLESTTVVGGGFTYSSSLSRALGVEGHPVLAAASIVSVGWSLSKSLDEYMLFMREAGMDAEEDYWVPETVAANLLALVESCRREGLKWYPRLMAMSTVEPVKAAFEDALLASLRAQADYEARSLAKEAIERASQPCNGVKAVGLEADWDLGVSIARVLFNEAVREGYTFVLAFTSRCRSSKYVILGGVLRGNRPLWSVENGYYIEAEGKIWGIVYVGGREELRVAYLSIVEELCRE